MGTKAGEIDKHIFDKHRHLKLFRVGLEKTPLKVAVQKVNFECCCSKWASAVGYQAVTLGRRYSTQKDIIKCWGKIKMLEDQKCLYCLYCLC